MDETARKRQDDWEKSLAAWKAKQGKDTGMYQPITPPKHHTTPSNTSQSTFLTKFLIFLAFAIPVAILGYALYINYLPFGYEKTYTLTIDESGVISPLSNEIYLTTPQGRKLLTLPNGVEGQVNLVLEPNVVLKDATVNVNIDGENVYLASPLTTELDNMEWDYDWDFTQSISQDWQGTAQYNAEEACTYFNAYNEDTLSLPNSEDLFESGQMSIYVKWKPSTVSPLIGNNQQIVGHYNWEIYQGQNELRFQIGRVNDVNGTFHSVSYPVTDEFFGQQHEAIAVYSPDTENGNGYIELWVDSNLAGRTLIGSDIIYKDYNPNNDLSVGWSPHNFGKNAYFDGCIYSAKIGEAIVEQKLMSANLNLNNKIIPIVGKGMLRYIEVKVTQ